jgi:hypothetical protein
MEFQKQIKQMMRNKEYTTIQCYDNCHICNMSQTAQYFPRMST